MDLFSIILFLGMYYLRPQEWGTLFRSLRPVQLTMILGILSLTLREKKVHFKDLFRTPHDYALILFFAWVILTSGAPYSTFKQVANLIVFYAVIVQTLTSIPRLKTFVSWWAVFIMIIAALALGGEYGFDIFHSYDITHGVMKDRLALNISIFDNPNALAHSVVPVIPMLYFLLFWKRPFAMKGITIALLSIPLWCVYLTLSKGAFLTGFATILATLTFGRPKPMQILILAVGIGLGVGALYKLPRMGELHKAKTDEAIQGRIAAYTYGYKCVTTLWTGIGYGNWMESFYAQSRRYKIVKARIVTKTGIIAIRRKVPERFWKAAHGSYNQMGAELGFIGLALFFGMVWCNFRTLCFAKTVTPEEERVRRILFVLLITYLISSWMVDFGYRPTFFMFTAATAAFHRHLRGIHRELDEETAREAAAAIPIWKRPAFAPGLNPNPSMASLQQGAMALAGAAMPGVGLSFQKGRESATSLKFKPVGMTTAELSEEGPTSGSIAWNKLGLLDLIMPFVITYAVVRFWAHILLTM